MQLLTRLKPSRFWFGCILFLAIVSSAVFSNTFQAGFQYADEQTFVQNSALHNPWDVKSVWNVSPSHFIPNWTFALNYAISGTGVWSYRLFNTILHFLASLVSFLLLRITFDTPLATGSRPAKNGALYSLFGALFFLCHPLQTQAVASLSERSTALAAVFYLTTLYGVAKHRLGGGRIFYLIALLSAFAAFFSKETAYTLPFALLLYEFVFFGKDQRNWKTTGLTYLPFFTILIASYVMIHLPEIQVKGIASFLNIADTVPNSQFFLAALNTIRTYVQLLCLPVRQNPADTYSFSEVWWESETFFSFLLVAGFFLLGILVRQKNRLMTFGIFWFFLTLGFDTGKGDPDRIFEEHRLYLPMLGAAAVALGAASSAIRNKKLLFSLGIIVTLVFSFLTYERNQIWLTKVSLWEEVVRKFPASGNAHFNLANATMEAWKPGEGSEETLNKAAKHYKEAIRLMTPQYAEALNGFGIVLTFQGNFEEALIYYRRALKIKPLYAAARRNIKLVEYLTQRLGEDQRKEFLKKINLAYGTSYLQQKPAADKKQPESLSGATDTTTLVEENSSPSSGLE